MSTNYDDPNGDLLARALRAEAQRIVPAGDGLTQIRDRIEQRRSRFRWLVPGASIVTAAALAGGAFGIYSLSSSGRSLTTERPAHSAPASGSTQPATPGPSRTPIADNGTAITPIWPFADATEAANWERPSGTTTWHLDAVATAKDFVYMLGFRQNLVVVNDSASGQRAGDITLATTTTAAGQPATFTSIHLVRWGSGDKAPWEITAVTAPNARIDSPSYDGGVYSPTTVRYTLDGGVEEDVRVSLHGMYENAITSVHQTTGGGQHTATLTYPAMSGQRGYVVMADLQGLSGTTTLRELAVTPVHFLTPPTSPQSPPPTGTPAYFVAVKDNRLAVFYASGGGFARWLTPASDAASAPSSPQLDESHTWVYYLQLNSLMRVKVTGGTPQPVIVSEARVDAFAYSGDHDQFQVVAITGHSNPSNSPQQTVGWIDSDTGRQDGFPLPGTPPMVEQAAVARDGKHWAVTIRTGNAWGIRVFDTKAHAVADGVAVPCPVGESCSAPSYDAAGNLYFIAAQDARTWELLQWTGTAVNHVSTWTLSVQANPETATVDITPDAEAALVGTSSNQVYRIEHGKATLVPTQASQPTW